MSQALTAIILGYSDALYYFAGTKVQPDDNQESVQFFKNTDGSLMKFRSLYAAKQFLAACGFKQGQLALHSAYDEMIGNEGAQYTQIPWVAVVA